MLVNGLLVVSVYYKNTVRTEYSAVLLWRGSPIIKSSHCNSYLNIEHLWMKSEYRQISNISRTFVGN